MIAKTEAIVLKNYDFRETSKIVHFFTQKYGKVKGVMKGVRKDSRKFGSNVDKFSVNDLVYYRYRNSDLHLVSQCDLKGFFFPVRQDLKRSMAAMYLLELIDLVLPVEEPNEKIYKLMLEYLASLETTKDINKLVHILQIKILMLSGFKPHLDSCLKCHKPIKGRAKFSTMNGGLICENCKVTDEAIVTVSSGTVSSILFIERHSWNNCLKLGLSPKARAELKFILNNFLVYHLGRQLKSEKFVG